SARPCAEPRVSVGRRRASRYFGSTMSALLRSRTLERKRSDFEGATLRPDWIGRQPRRGRKGTVLLSRLYADAFVHESGLQIPAVRISVRPADRRESPTRIRCA